MVLAENKSGIQLLEYINIAENDINIRDEYKPITSSFALVKCDGKYLIAFNKFRCQWEFPAGKIEGNETYKECATRELFEETNQIVNNFEFKGLFKIYDINKKQIRYRAAFFTEVDKIMKFKENNEMYRIMLWDLKSNVGYFDEVDIMMLQLCIG